MNLLTYISITLSTLIIFYPHPVILLVTILAQATSLCLLIWLMTKTSWFSFILFLIFLGGLMVLFVYIVSLASNEMFKFNFLSNLLILISSVSLSLLSINHSFFFEFFNNFGNSFSTKIFTVFTKNLITPTILIMAYLLLVLVIAVKISSKMEGPIRNFI